MLVVGGGSWVYVGDFICIFDMKIKDKLFIFAKRFLFFVMPNWTWLRVFIGFSQMRGWHTEYIKNTSFSHSAVFSNRQKLYDYINREYLNCEAISFFEFGVRHGGTMRLWLNSNDHLDSCFYGFDSFSGLPSDLEGVFGSKEGLFSTNSEMPRISDSRVSLIKGLFQDTLDPFLADYKLSDNQPSQLVIHIDSDLYSSALYVLTRCHDVIVPGTIIIFDEFNSILHEFRALSDYVSSYGRTYRVIGVTDTFYEQVAIQMVT